MHVRDLNEHITTYTQKIEKLDSHAVNLSTDAQRAYTAAKKRFLKRLDAWRQTLGSDIAIYKNNVKEGYNELEAHVFRSS